MSCPFKHLSSNPHGGEFVNETENVENTISNWGCQVIRDGGLNFFIKTDKFIDCAHEEDLNPPPAVCPFRKTPINENNKNNNIQSAPPPPPPPPLHHPPITTPTTITTSIDKDGHFTIPLVNMPPFLTFGETKDILLSMDIKLKDENDTWEQLKFYHKNENDEEYQEIKNILQLQDIIKENNHIIFLK